MEKELTLLGKKTEYIGEYSPHILEAFANKHCENDYFVTLNCPEFTSLCPITNQPDFACVTISYVPDGSLVESKSLKLYLHSFRNHGSFHEDCVNIIINYIPDKLCVESKSLKLYLFAFRNHGEFHENCVNRIMKDLIKLMSPRYIEVWGEFMPRGGISIDPFANHGKGKWKEFAQQRLLQHDIAPTRVYNR